MPESFSTVSFFWDKLVRPAAFRLDAEHAHELGVRALAAGFAAPFYSGLVDPILECERFGLRFKSPLGIAAGFDKNGVAVEQLARLGFGFVEVGTVTARPQTGNPRPRMFRLPDDKALINRLGFNNDGARTVAKRLEKVRRICPIGINIGRNKDVINEDAVENYLEAFTASWPVADYLVVNISSPNTPGLRDLQKGENIERLLGALQEANDASSGERPRKALLVKIAPDLEPMEVEALTDAVVRHDIAGVIATNTTVTRDALVTREVSNIGPGGLSGAPLKHRSTEIIRLIYSLTAGTVPIIGVGGIFTAEDAFEKIAAGASLVQAYTGFIYGGPGFPAEINGGLARILRERGFNSFDEAVGSGER